MTTAVMEKAPKKAKKLAKKPTKAKARKQVKGKRQARHPGDQVCISIRPGFYEQFEEKRGQKKFQKLYGRPEGMPRSAAIEAGLRLWIKAGCPSLEEVSGKKK